MNNLNTAPCGCWIGAWFGVNRPPMCATHSLTRHTWTVPSVPLRLPPEARILSDDAQRLHPDDIKAIAKRFAALVDSSRVA